CPRSILTAEDKAVRKRLIASVFITFLLCAPAFAGHVIAGGGWCECGSSDACICDPGEERIGQVSRPVSDESSQRRPVDLGSETLFVIAALLLVLRYKA